MPTAIDALQEFSEKPSSAFSHITYNVISHISGAVRGGNPEPADLIVIAARLGISIATLRSIAAPFDRLLELAGVTPPWFPDSTGTPPDWLDVALVDLLDSRPELLDAWTDEVADFLTANVMADEADIRDRYHRWHNVLATDPNNDTILPHPRNTTATHQDAPLGNPGE